MPRDSAAADRPASYLVGTAAAFPLFFRDRTKPINQLPFSPSAKFPKSGSSCESRASLPLSPEQRAQMLVRSREAANAFVDDLSEIRRVLAMEGASIADIRRLSVVLRRLLVDRDLAVVAAPRIGRITLLTPDNKPIYAH